MATAQATPGNFNANTRKKILQLADITRPVGGGTPSPVILPKVGLFAGLYLAIRGAVAGTLTVPNGLGFASAINRVRLTFNGSTDLINISGAGYHYLYRDMIDDNAGDIAAQSNARSAVTAAAFNLDMYFPLMLNKRDPIGMIMLQNEATIASLGIDFLADASVATGATVTCTVTPYMEYFTVPAYDEDMPNLNVIRNISEDLQQMPAAGDFQYPWLRGNTYMRIAHGAGIGAAGADNFSKYQLRFNQQDYVEQFDAKFLDLESRLLRPNRARPAGVIQRDFVASSGLGAYGLMRDIVDSSDLTDIQSVITALAGGPLYTVRDQLIVMEG